MRHMYPMHLFCLAAAFFLLIIPGVTFGEEGHDTIVFPPMDGARIKNPRPEISVRLDDMEGSREWALVRLKMDDVDVSPLTTSDGVLLTYIPQTDLAYGKHTMTLEAMDGNGVILPSRYWHFIIPRSDVFDRADAQILLDAQTDLRLGAKKDSPEPEWKLQSNATFHSIVETGDLGMSLNANVWYADQEKNEATGETFNLNNYLLEIDYRKQRLSFGDLNVAGTELISPSISRRGGLLELTYGQTAARTFLLRSDQVTGFDNMMAVDDPDQRLLGGSLAHQWKNAGDLTVTASVVSGKNREPDGYNTETMAPASRGRIYSLQMRARPLDEKLDLTGELGISRFDQDTTDAFGFAHGKAWLTRIAGRAGSYDYGGGYKRVGRNFFSIVDTTAPDNREDYTVYGTKTFAESSLTAGFFNITDNIQKRPLLPVIQNTGFNLAYNLYKTNWPVIFFNADLGFQKSSHEPDSMDAIDNRTRTFTGGFALVREKWNLSPSYTFTGFEDDSIVDSESRTHQTSLVLGLQPTARISLNPSLSWILTDAGQSMPAFETMQGSIAGTYLLNERHNLFTTLSAIDSAADDDTVHTTTVDGICQYNWHPETRFLAQARKTVSLRGRYNRTHDHISDDVLEDYAVTLIIGIGGLPLVLY